MHAQVEDMACSLLSLWPVVSINAATGAAELRILHKPVLVHTEDILGPVSYTKCRDGVAHILLPLEYR